MQSYASNGVSILKFFDLCIRKNRQVCQSGLLENYVLELESKQLHLRVNP